MNQRVLTFNYVLKDINGQILDSSAESPMVFLEGASQILPVLEQEIIHMENGTKKNIKLKASDAYGDMDPNMIIDVPKRELAHLQFEEGTFLQMNMGEQMRVVRVAAVTEDAVTLDGNHPLAGQALEFDIEMVESRPATSEELSHGHAHGVGGHQH